MDLSSKGTFNLCWQTSRSKSVKNPQANAILKHIHQVVGSMLKTKNLKEVQFGVVDPWSAILASVAYAVRCSFHSTLQATPGQLVFGRDMLLNIKFVLNYHKMWADKQKRIATSTGVTVLLTTIIDIITV